MKLEIEISEQMICDAIQKEANEIVSNKIRRWDFPDDVKNCINHLWDANVERVVREVLDDTDTLKAKVAAVLERKIQGQLTALMKNSGPRPRTRRMCE